ncbi:SDR family NAD(P)-dependent oxidoreductase [Herbiconiux ginsengi]|uniref:3-oxoacyl-[acyl-carrier protein] reductase n=1 Tax=Herbiconiux ginsengi TaxID=381665 RepID=A0A1H3TGZ0_9MICO|nr:SDR family oxidoreductase [Herbiconiux ginsengi]SDZ48925.1 3-oxoacyl-[acyl-carrier protein] reductase [Herbiconiux ginsengi]
MTRLDNKIVVITGSGTGLGLEYALACSAVGATVVINDVNAHAAEAAVRQVTEAGGRALAVVGSVADWDDAKRLVDTTVAEFGRIDGFVANAAILHMVEPWAEEETRLRAIAEVNILGVQFCIRHAMRSMIDTGTRGSIVTVVSGAMYGFKGMSAYGASKGAVAGMTVNWAIEGAERGIRVNAVSPFAMTQMTIDTLDETKADPGRFPTPDRVAPVVVSLLSDDTATVSGALVRFDARDLSVYQTTVSLIESSDAWTPDGVSQALTSRFPAGPAEAD